MFDLKKQTINTDESKIDELLLRAVDEIIHKEELKKQLLSGKKLRIKFGIDPTSPSIHLGRSVPLLKLRAFQDLGHTIVFIIGDATGVIGDTSDKNSERPMLSAEEVKKNAETYFSQADKLLDIKKTEKHYNSQWLNTLTYKDIGEHANQFSVSDFIARENIKKRLEKGTRVSLREVLYPLMQGYDSVEVKADVEIGGTDQRFNLLAGRKLQEYFGQQPQNIMMTRLILGTDGRKMSSSWENTINITDDPDDMFGKVMSLEDSSVGTYFEHATTLSVQEVEKMKVKISQKGKEARDAKMCLARAIVSLYHNENTAQKAEENFVLVFNKKEAPNNTEEVTVAKKTNLFDAVSSQVQSKTELRRLINEGAVNTADGEKITDIHFIINKSMTLKIGKRRCIKITVQN
jgi:tyrosyl-tRNA synthetase